METLSNFSIKCGQKSRLERLWVPALAWIFTPKGLHKKAQGQWNATLGHGMWSKSFTLQGLHKEEIPQLILYPRGFLLCNP